MPAPSIMMGEYLLKFEEEDMGEEFEEMARKELRETPDIVSHALAVLKDYLTGEESRFLKFGVPHNLTPSYMTLCREIFFLFSIFLLCSYIFPAIFYLIHLTDIVRNTS